MSPNARTWKSARELLAKWERTAHAPHGTMLVVEQSDPDIPVMVRALRLLVLMQDFGPLTASLYAARDEMNPDLRRLVLKAAGIAGDFESSVLEEEKP